MGKWTDRPIISDPGELAGGDTLLMALQSRTVGDRDVQVPADTLRSFLGVGITVGVTQTAHGLSVGDVVRFDGADYVVATADTEGNAEAVGVVTAVETDAFAYQTAGVVSTLSGLTPGELYYLQDNGSLGTSAGTVDKPVLIATSATTAVLILAISGAGAGGAANFTDLGDVPSSYSGHGGKVVAVTSGEDGLEFIAGGGGGAAWGGITGTLADQTDLGVALDARPTSSTVSAIEALTQAEYDLLTPDSGTLYVITDA